MKRNKLLAFDIIFIITTLLLVFASAFSYRYINNLSKSADLVNHSNLVKLELEKALSYVKDAESGVRGYVITKDSIFIEPVKEAMRKAQSSLSVVHTTIRDNPSQLQLLNSLQSLILRKFDVLNYGLTLPKPKPKTDPNYLEGRTVMENVRSVMNRMMANQETLLSQHESERNRFIFLTPFFFLLFSIIAIVVVILVYARLRRENKLRTQAETSEAIIHNFFQQVPAMLVILKGKEHRFEFANPPYLDFIGNSDIIGKTVLEVMPDVTRQGFVELLDNVFETGEPYVGKETRLLLHKKEMPDELYVNFIYQPYKGISGNVDGIMLFCYDVSEMLVNRKKIEELEQRSRMAIEASAMGVFDWDLQNQQFESSARLMEIFGYKDPAGITHKDLISRLHPDDRPIREKAVAESYEKGSMAYEARIIWQDNSIHWVNTYGVVIYNDKKEPMRMFGSVIDVTRNKTMLEELKESESKFRLLANFMTQQVWIAGAEGDMNYFNQTVYDYSGVNDNIDFEKVGWLNTIHPDEKADNLKKWNYAVTNGQEFVSEHRLLDQFGKYRWHISQAVPQFDKNGNVRMWVGTSTDIQDQKDFAEELGKKVIERTEKLVETNIELRRSEDRYYSMINEVQDYAILMLDKEGNVQNWNKGAEKIKGYKSEEIIGKNFRLFHLKEERDAGLPERLIDEAQREGKAENHGWRLRKDGSKFWASVVLTALHDEQKNIIGFSKVTRDLTDRKNAEEKLQEYLRDIEQKNMELERSNAELRSFNYIASHDLQEPLRKIQAFSSLILDKEKDKLSQSANDYFNRINKAASGMQNLIEALISYSQTNTGVIALTETNLNDILNVVKNDLSNSIEEKNVIIEHDTLPVVQIDPVQFLQLFTNLISNAIKYSKPGIPPHIKITSGIVSGREIDDPEIVPMQPYWKISIADNGIGFEQKYEQKIFELFQRLHGKQEYLGTGIGLAICKKIIRNHDGFISATGTPGIGSVFNIFLPLKNNFY